MVMPRAFSSFSRSVSIPVRALTSEVLPWSMCPAVPRIRCFTHSPLPAETVTDPAHGLEANRMGRVPIDILSQPDDQTVQGPGLGVIGIAPYRMEQFAARDDLPFFLEKERQDPHLHLGHVNLPLGCPGAVGERKDLVAAEAVTLFHRVGTIP